MGSTEKISVFFLLTFFLVFNGEIPFCSGAKNLQKNVINDIADVKDFKKLLRTKNNVLTLFINSPKQNASVMKIFEETAEHIKGQGTMVITDCSGEAKKLCKKLKVNPDPYVIKHYKDGEFHKDYDRKHTVSSMLNFMRDPAGDIPWEEDSTTSGIVHIPDPTSLARLLRKELGPVMVMFYAPWCGFCKQLKPEYAAAATELKGHSILAAIDVNKPENIVVRNKYNITGFPTLIYFENGMKMYNYEGENNKDSIVTFMKNPSSIPTKPFELEWSAVENDIIHLTDETFEKAIKETESMLVMFYAPWCGHCKRLKPEYEKAAEYLKTNKIHGTLAALDATKEIKTAKKFNVNGYPTLKYFKNNEFQYDVNLREEKELINFMKEPKKPPPPLPEKPWSEEDSEVVHLTTESFKSFLKKKKHVLVMFYAPWCGHCKKSKPEFTSAAEAFKDDSKISFAAIDCTAHQPVCSVYDVKGYPTFKIFHYFNKEPIEDYSGGRTEQDFVSYMKKFSRSKQYQVLSNEMIEDDSWSDVTNSGLILHVTDDDFDMLLQQDDFFIVLFYTNDCQECLALKHEYSHVALMVKNKKLKGKLAACNASKCKKIILKNNIVSYPTIYVYRRGVFSTVYSGRFKALDLFNFFEKHQKKPKEEL